MDDKPTLMVEMSDGVYRSAAGHVLRRQPSGPWCFYNRYGDLLDSDLRRYDVAKRHNLMLALDLPYRSLLPQEESALLKREFPDFDRATLPRLPKGFTCAAWHNDSCPTWYEDDPAELEPGKLMIAVDFPDPELREFPDSDRFTLHMVRKKDEGPEPVISSDDWEVVENAVRFIRYVRDLKLGFHVDTPGADYVNSDGSRTFAEKEAARLDITVETLRMDPYETAFMVWRALGLMEEAPATVESPAPAVDWHARRDELKAGMVFRCWDDSVVQLLERYPGDDLLWSIAEWQDKWVREGGALAPGDLRERLPDDWAGDVPGETKIDWHARRDELRPDMVFRADDGSVVRLDRRVPGDGTKWYVMDWHDGWSCEDSTIEPSDLRERLPDDWAGENQTPRSTPRPGPR